MKIDNENTFRRALADNINLFLGAGFSLLSQDSDGRRLPLAAELKTELTKAFDLKFGDSLDLAQLCTFLESQNKQRLNEYLKARFTVAKFSEKYCNLESITIKSIFTTNVDDLVFNIYAESSRSYINDMMLRGPVFNDKHGIDYVALHGSVRHEDERLVFSTLDIASSFSSDPDKWHFLTHRLQEVPTLFWGYSVSDSGVLQALSPNSTKGRQQQPQWILLGASNLASSEYYRALGFQIIVGETLEMLEYLQGFSSARSETYPLSEVSTEVLFPVECIPSVGKVPVRSIRDFYLGAPPTWYDVFSGQIHTTEYGAKIINSIHAGKGTIVVGIPACGKTTLMMQVASTVGFAGHKLVVDQLTREKASFIVNRLGNAPALVFVDNFATDIDAFACLLDTPNVLSVGFDRDYQFEQTSHRLRTRNYEVIAVTELSQRDIQAIYDRIPSEIRTSSLSRPEVALGVEPSLFEFVEQNTIEPSLRDRFMTILTHLSQSDRTLHDLLIMFCYVSACGVPVSYDTVSAFLRGEFATYDELYEMVQRLGATVTEYFGANSLEEQDYFVSRSSIVGETVLRGVSPSQFRRVLSQFHEQVSPIRICRYDIFKRKAFDKDYIKKAFPNWKEGLEFYEKIYDRDNSPFLLQQAALYLAGKRRYKEAFVWIDKALMESGHRHMSIRNSHAVILFDANIDLAGGDNNVRQSLDESMEILANCYNFDRRKTYHAMRFADQAIQYSKAYSDSRSKEYLDTASRWLRQEYRDNPWHRGLRRLRDEINNELTTYYSLETE